MKSRIPLVVFCVTTAYSIYILMDAMLKGNFDRGSASRTIFDSESAYKLHKTMASHPRIIGTKHYQEMQNEITKYIFQDSNLNNGRKINLNTESGDIVASMHSGTVQFQPNITNFRVKLQPNQRENNSTLLFCAHLDGHNVGGCAYDDVINVIGEIELIRAIQTTGSASNLNVLSLVDGSEEFGLHGAKLFSTNVMNRSHSYYYLNLESMGVSRPFALVTKGPKSSSIQRSWRRGVKYGIMATFCNDIFNSGLISSGSATHHFDNAGMNGAQAVFIGTPSQYHTKYDKLTGDSDDIRYLGDLLYEFASHFEPDKIEVSVASYGISPFAIVVDNSTLSIIASTLALICACQYFISHKKALKSGLIQFLRSLLVIVVIFLIFAAGGGLLYMFNSMSYASSPSLFVFLFLILGVASFIELSDRFGVEQWDLSRLLLDAILLLLARNLDTAIPLCLIALFQLLAVGAKHRVAKFLAFLGQVISSSLFFGLLVPTLINYSAVIDGPLADILGMVVICLYVVHVAMPIADIVGKCPTLPVCPKFIIQLLIVFAVAICKPYPYNEKYILRGSFTHLFRNGSSQFAFAPDAGKRTYSYLDKMTAPHPGISFQHFDRPLWHGEAYVEQATGAIPHQFQGENAPRYRFDKNANGTYTFHSEHPNSTNMIALVFTCRNDQKCVRSLMEIPDPLFHGFGNPKYTSTLMIRNVGTAVDAHFELEGDDAVAVELVYMTYEESPEFVAFQDKFGPFVQQAVRERFVQDTVYVIDTELPA